MTQTNAGKSDVLVLGAGIVGISTALMLMRGGYKVTVIDKREPGEETSHGNAGLIEKSSIVPYHFPQGLGKLLRYGMNRRADMHYSPFAMPRLAPWLWSFWRASTAGPLGESAKALRPLIDSCTDTHAELADMAGDAAWSLIRKTGWMHMLGRPAEFAEGPALLAEAQKQGLNAALLDAKALYALEPSLKPGLSGALHWLDPWTVSDPGGLVRAYADAFVAAGGRILRGDAAGLMREGDEWVVPLPEGRVSAPQAVIALGPWAGKLLAKMGKRFPLEVKRGHHMVYDMPPEDMPRHPIMENDSGFVITPTVDGLRLTTGVEFAGFDAPPNLIQINRAEKRARELVNLGPRKLSEPWLGRRPCLPDMRPIVGPIDQARFPGLWGNFGHAHHGLTLGPSTGKMLTQMMRGETPFVDPKAFSADRF